MNEVNSRFQKAYRDLEEQMKALAEADGDVYVPNPEPDSPVDYVFVCMEPSLGRWASSLDDARQKVESGFRNFLAHVDTMILHFSIRRYLCKPTDRYHITDFSKGAMLVERAGQARAERYERWYGLLRDEIDLVAKPDAGIVAVGKDVSRHLKRQGFERPFTQVIHYSGLAGRARRDGIANHEAEFEEFSHTVSLQDVIATAQEVIGEAGVPPAVHNEALTQVTRSQLSLSRKQLIFNYKLAFETMRG